MVDGDEQTAQILDGQSGTIAVVGDVSQTDGSTASFTDCYEPTWGRHKARTRPAPGNHDYRTPGAAPYYEYFGAAAGPPGQGWYSYDLGAWHVVSLNSNCLFVGCEAGSPQEQWLRADLAANPAACTLAYWHHPRFSSGRPLQLEEMEPLWAALYEAGAEIVLSGHDHIYERFAPQTPIGDPSPTYGIREFIVGTGGFGHSGLQPVPLPLSTVRNNDTLGVLRLTLDPTGYAWTFLPVAGATFSDSGTGVCHDAQSDVTPPTTDLTLPSPGVVVSGLQMLAADAFDGQLDATRVDFLIGQTVVATDTTRPFAFQLDTASIPDGVRVLKARGVDAAGNASTSARGIVIDNADPVTTIANGPTGTVRTYAPAFYLRSEPGATFTCSLDGRAFRACTSPVVYANLASGRHVFRARALDAAGRLEPVPAVRSWTIDRRAPATKLVLARTTLSAPGRATFRFAANERAAFRCSLDGSDWRKCASPMRYRKLRRGVHTFLVRAVDRVGNPDKTPVRHRWTVARITGRGD